MARFYAFPNSVFLFLIVSNPDAFFDYKWANIFIKYRCWARPSKECRGFRCVFGLRPLYPDILFCNKLLTNCLTLFLMLRPLYGRFFCSIGEGKFNVSTSLSEMTRRTEGPPRKISSRRIQPRAGFAFRARGDAFWKFSAGVEDFLGAGTPLTRAPPDASKEKVDYDRLGTLIKTHYSEPKITSRMQQ